MTLTLSNCTLMTKQEFLEDCNNGLLIDYDEFGRIATFFDFKNELSFSLGGIVHPSSRNEIPESCEYIIWYNR